MLDVKPSSRLYIAIKSLNAYLLFSAKWDLVNSNFAYQRYCAKVSVPVESIIPCCNHDSHLKLPTCVISGRQLRTLTKLVDTKYGIFPLFKSYLYKCFRLAEKNHSYLRFVASVPYFYCRSKQLWICVFPLESPALLMI